MKSQQQVINLLKIDELSSTPKYQQLVNAVRSAVEQGQLEQGQPMPSINELSFKYDISRITVEKGYNQLRKMGILEAFHGKGYFIAKTSIGQQLRIFLMFNKLSAHKKIIYDAFVETLGDKAAIDFYIYNNNATLFNRLLNHRKDTFYTHYVIIPHFVEGAKSAYQSINALPKQKLILLDKQVKDIIGEYGCIYEHFSENIYQALCQALESLQKYQMLKLVFPEKSYFPQEIIEGFISFCQNYAFDYKIIAHIIDETIAKGEVYICLMEDDLIPLLEKINDSSLKMGQDIGVISYNETKIKRFIMNGITTISTDFHAMGVSAAQLILESSKTHISNPFYLNLRPSL